MEKKKYADLALILALISLVSPILAILTNQGIIPKIVIFGTLAVSGTGLLGLILGIIGYKETEHKWKSIAAIVIYIVGTILFLIFGFSVIYDVIWSMMSDLLPY
jgi:peptidoglycan/LPS O-acetylase OafA/YrhL